MLFTIGLIILVLSTFLTIFSIFFNYDEEKPVKLSKWGWVAVAGALALAIGNGVVKKIEHDQGEVAKIKNDSLQTALIAKNDRLLHLVESLEDSSMQSFENINEQIGSSLSSLNQTNLQLATVANRISESQAEVQKSIFEASHTLPDSFKGGYITIDVIQFSIDTSMLAIEMQQSMEEENIRTYEELRAIQDILRKYNFPNNQERNLYVDLSRNGIHNLMTSHLIISLELDQENNAYMNSRIFEEDINYNYASIEGDSALRIYAFFDISVDLPANYSNIYDLCKNRVTIAIYSTCPKYDFVEVIYRVEEVYLRHQNLWIAFPGMRQDSFNCAKWYEYRLKNFYCWQ